MGNFSGYIYLHKSLLDSSIWDNQERFDIRSAWIDLLLTANYEDSTAMSRSGDEIVVRRGQVLTSQVKLAKRWGWSRKKVRTFLEHLKSAKMLNFERLYWDRGATLVTILNYSVYQDSSRFGDIKRASKEHQRNIEGTSRVAHLNKYKETNEINEEGGGIQWE